MGDPEEMSPKECKRFLADVLVSRKLCLPPPRKGVECTPDPLSPSPGKSGDLFEVQAVKIRLGTRVKCVVCISTPFQV